MRADEAPRSEADYSAPEDCRDCFGDGTFCPSEPDKCDGCETCERCQGSGKEPMNEAEGAA